MPEGNKSGKPDSPKDTSSESWGSNSKRMGLEHSYTLQRNPIFGVRERYHYVNKTSKYVYVGHESFDLPAGVVFNILISIDYEDVLKTALEESGFGRIDVDRVRACFRFGDEPNATFRAFRRLGLGEPYAKTVLVEACAEGSRVDEFEMRVKEKAAEGTTLKDAFIEVFSKSYAEFEDRARHLVEDGARLYVEKWMHRDDGSAASVEIGGHAVRAESVCARISEILSRFRFSFNPVLSALDSKCQPFHGTIESEESLRDAITESCLMLFKAVDIFLTRIEALKVAIKRVKRVPKRSRSEAFTAIAEGHYDMMPSALYAHGGRREIAEQFDDAVRWPTSVSDKWDAFVLLTDASNVAADLLLGYRSYSEEHRRLEDYMKGLVTLSYDLLFSKTRSHPFLDGADGERVFKNEIALNLDGGTLDVGGGKQISLDRATRAFVTPPEPTKAGYDFGGWALCFDPVVPYIRGRGCVVYGSESVAHLPYAECSSVELKAVWAPTGARADIWGGTECFVRHVSELPDGSFCDIDCQKLLAVDDCRSIVLPLDVPCSFVREGIGVSGPIRSSRPLLRGKHGCVEAEERSSPLTYVVHYDIDPVCLLDDFQSYLIEIGEIEAADEVELIGDAFEFGNSRDRLRDRAFLSRNSREGLRDRAFLSRNSREGLHDRVFLSRTLETKLGLSKRSFSIEYLDELLVVQALACLEGGYRLNLADGLSSVFRKGGDAMAAMRKIVLKRSYVEMRASESEQLFRCVDGHMGELLFEADPASATSWWLDVDWAKALSDAIAAMPLPETGWGTAIAEQAVEASRNSESPLMTAVAGEAASSLCGLYSLVLECGYKSVFGEVPTDVKATIGSLSRIEMRSSGGMRYVLSNAFKRAILRKGSSAENQDFEALQGESPDSLLQPLSEMLERRVSEFLYDMGALNYVLTRFAKFGFENETASVRGRAMLQGEAFRLLCERNFRFPRKVHEWGAERPFGGGRRSMPVDSLCLGSADDLAEIDALLEDLGSETYSIESLSDFFILLSYFMLKTGHPIRKCNTDGCGNIFFKSKNGMKYCPECVAKKKPLKPRSQCKKSGRSQLSKHIDNGKGEIAKRVNVESRGWAKAYIEIQESAFAKLAKWYAREIANVAGENAADAAVRAWCKKAKAATTANALKDIRSFCDLPFYALDVGEARVVCGRACLDSDAVKRRLEASEGTIMVWNDLELFRRHMAAVEDMNWSNLNERYGRASDLVSELESSMEPNTSWIDVRQKGIPSVPAPAPAEGAVIPSSTISR